MGYGAYRIFDSSGNLVPMPEAKTTVQAIWGVEANGIFISVGVPFGSQSGILISNSDCPYLLEQLHQVIIDDKFVQVFGNKFISMMRQDPENPVIKKILAELNAIVRETTNKIKEM